IDSVSCAHPAHRKIPEPMFVKLMLHRLILHAPLIPKHANSNSMQYFDLAVDSKEYHMADAAKRHPACTRGAVRWTSSGIRERLNTGACLRQDDAQRTVRVIVQSQDCFYYHTHAMSTTSRKTK